MEFFLGLERRHSSPLFVIPKTMSAAVFVYTSEGFIVASDGRSSGTSPDDPVEDDHVKIFEVRAEDINAAYVLNGHIGDYRSKYDLVAEARKQTQNLSAMHFSDSYGYINALGRNLQRYITDAAVDGLIDPPDDPRVGPDFTGLLAALFIVGYFYGHPGAHRIDFLLKSGQKNADFRAERMFVNLRHGDAISFGSQLVANEIRLRNPLFARYLDRLNIDLFTASSGAITEYAKAFIESQSDDAAREVDPQSIRIGGHMHAAIVRPSGFAWITPPLIQAENALNSHEWS